MPVKSKAKGKEKKLSLDDEEKPKLAPVDVNFIINSIENITSFAKLRTKFCLDLLHAGKPITSSNPKGGIFQLKPPAEGGDFLSGDDIVDVDLHYKLTVQPDNVEDVVLLANCPMLIVLSVFPDLDGRDVQSEDSNVESVSAEEAEEAEDSGLAIEKTPIGYGSLDLIPIITMKSLDNSYEIYVYPETTFPNIKTPKVKLRLYSVIGILQNTPLRFSNILTLTLENIFNPTEVISVYENQLRVDFSLVTDSENPQRPVFSFSQGQIETFFDGQINKRWSGLPMVKGLETMTMFPKNSALTEIYVEDTDLFEGIDMSSNVCAFNSVQRTLLTEENTINLEKFILEKQQHLRATITVGDEEFPRYIGNVDLSPLVYPDVHQGRFVVEFKIFQISQKPSTLPQPLVAPKVHQHTVKIKEQDFLLPGDNIPVTIKPQGRPLTSPRVSKAQSIKKSKSISVSPNDMINSSSSGPMFAVFAVDFLKPLTERSIEDDDSDCAKLLAVKCRADKLPRISEEKLQNITRTELADEIITTIKDLPNCSEYFLIQTENEMKINCEEFQQSDCFKDMRDNLMEKITKYTAANYQTKMPIHETNAEFKNLMVNVYNDLVCRIEEVVNDYYAGSRNFVDFAKIMALQNIRMFTAYECYNTGFLRIAEAIWDDIEVETEDDENIFIDLVVKDLMIHNQENAEKRLMKLFDINPSNYYGLLINLYLTYIENTDDPEVWLSQLLKLTRKHSDEVECWALLHVVYLSFSYRPGYMHAKMMCERNYPLKIYPHFWERKHNFYEVIDHENPFCCSVFIFLKLGLWAFAKLLFEKFKDVFDEYNRNRIQCYILHQMKELNQLKDFLNVLHSSKENVFIAAIYLANLKYESGEIPEAIVDYEVIYHDPENQDLFFLSPYLRCGFWELKNKNYTDAQSYFWTCCKNANTSVLAWYGLGISLYRLKKYDEAELAFSKASNIFGKIAELWIYFTMVNLAKKDYHRATECCDISRRYTLYEPELEEEMNNLFREHSVRIPSKF